MCFIDEHELLESLGKIQGWQRVLDFANRNNIDEVPITADLAISRLMLPVLDLGGYDRLNQRIDFLSGANRTDFWRNMGTGTATGWIDFADELGNVLREATLMLTRNMQDAGLMVSDTDVSIVSSAALLHTCPANRMQRINTASISNANRAPALQLAIIPNGGTGFTLNGLGTAIITNILVGGVGPVGLGGLSGMVGPVYLQAGDTIEIADGAFQAFDVMRKQFQLDEWVV